MSGSDLPNTEAAWIGENGHGPAAEGNAVLPIPVDFQACGLASLRFS
jgi:hypothetical protein